MPIGFFDSGIGGLSVLRESLKILPNENYIYFGDSKNAPYGEKRVEEVKELTYDAAKFLLDKGVKALLIACNTATSAAVASLRVTYPNIPIVGIEPAVKPAVELKTNKDIIIMATPVTIKEKKFNNLIDRFKENTSIIPMPCAGLAELIEKGNFDSLELREYIKNKFKDYTKDNIGAIVLGCTHYPFIANLIREIVGENIPIIDGGMGTCKELKRRLDKADLLSRSKNIGNVKIYNSLNTNDIIEVCNNLLYK